MPLQLQTYKASALGQLLRMTLHSTKTQICNSFARSCDKGLKPLTWSAHAGRAGIWPVNRKSRLVLLVSFT